MRGEASFMQVIERDPGSRLHLVSGGFLDPGVLAGTPEHLTPVLVALEQTYDLVLLACPALGESALGLALASSVDAVVLIDDGSDPDASDAAADALGAATPAPVLVSGPITLAAANAA
jgi:MinD-like ATPase involved in chromosome partitioning or flagellar assembly